ncbi:MAG: DUF1326 domain-containing protein [Deltaproteobacteria bacterium]|nr:MAG: DUF1326 domain-containing protein [Deltaproteobacteria bacterium]
MGLARPAIARMLGAFAALVLAVAIGVPLAYWHRVPPWSLAGFSMTLCPCASPCPCRSGRRPTHPDCEAATFVHVVRGHYGSVSLDGLKFVDVADMQRGAWIIVYGEAGTPDEVQAAMVAVAENMLMPRIFFAPLLARWLGPRVTVRRVERIEYKVSENRLRRRVSIPGILELDARLRADAEGRPRELVPALDMLANKIAYADNLAYRYTGPDLPRPLDYSGRQANMKTFHVAKEDYDQERMLVQEARAMRGAWTPRQRAIITAMREAGELLPRSFGE